MEQPRLELDDRAALDLLIRGFQVSRMLRLVADLGIADLIDPQGSTAVEVLAEKCGAQAQPLKRVLRALGAFGVFNITRDGQIVHTSRSRLLRTDILQSLHHSARFWTAPGSWAAWGKLDAALCGDVPHVAAWGTDRFDYLRSHPEEARCFDAMMANFPDNRHAAVAESYDFSNARVVADLGGGNGAALREILPRYPTLQGLLFDREDVVKALGPNDLLGGRIVAEEGSFLERIPEGADIYMLMRVLHDWSDEDCQQILNACHAAMAPHTKLLICDHILAPDPSQAPPTEYLVDTQMMAMFGSARERTEEEFAALLSGSGFDIVSIIRTRSTVHVIEATRSSK